MPVMTWYQCPKLSMSIFDLVLIGFDKIGLKILNKNDLIEENANFGSFSPCLTCFWPTTAPVSMSKSELSEISKKNS